MKRLIIILSLYTVLLIIYSVCALQRMAGETLAVNSQFIVFNSLFLLPVLILAILAVIFVRNK